MKFGIGQNVLVGYMGKRYHTLILATKPCVWDETSRLYGLQGFKVGPSLEEQEYIWFQEAELERAKPFKQGSKVYLVSDMPFNICPERTIEEVIDWRSGMLVYRLSGTKPGDLYSRSQIELVNPRYTKEEREEYEYSI